MSYLFSRGSVDLCYNAWAVSHVADAGLLMHTNAWGMHPWIWCHLVNEILHGCQICINSDMEPITTSFTYNYEAQTHEHSGGVYLIIYVIYCMSFAHLRRWGFLRCVNSCLHGSSYSSDLVQIDLKVDNGPDLSAIKVGGGECISNLNPVFRASLHFILEIIKNTIASQADGTLELVEVVLNKTYC